MTEAFLKPFDQSQACFAMKAYCRLLIECKDSWPSYHVKEILGDEKYAKFLKIVRPIFERCKNEEFVYEARKYLF